MSYEFKFDNDLEKLGMFLNSVSKDDYPFNIDPFFTPRTLWEGDEQNIFTLYAYDGDKIIATYAARKLNYLRYELAFKNWVEDQDGSYSDVVIPGENQWYSSCQWVHKDYRGQKLGITMDRMKKDKIWELGGDVNYANCRAALKDYHITHLGYDKYQHQAYIPSGNVGGAGTSEDKEYYIVYEMAK